MAKSINPETLRTTEFAATDLQPQSDQDDAAFLTSLNQKQDEALHLSNELAAWFGDHSAQPIRL